MDHMDQQQSVGCWPTCNRNNNIGCALPGTKKYTREEAKVGAVIRINATAA